MRRIMLTIAYDGTDYAGFQSQPGCRTVEGELKRALTELTGEEIAVTGASRTDSGVHALGNIAVFDTESTIPAERFRLALLPYLPEDLRAVSSEEVAADWHPRRQKCRKTYEYAYYCGLIEDPLSRRYMSYVSRIPDVSKMREAAAYLTGEHDFTSFANPSSQVLMAGGSAVRTVYGIDITEEEAQAFPGLAPAKLIRIRISGSGFLYNMVRIIAGTLLQTGNGLWTPGRVKEALEARDRTKAGPTAEARGLTLVGMEYL